MAYPKYVMQQFQVGLIDEKQLSKVAYPEGACIDCQDVVWMPSGAMTKRRGYEKLHPTPVAAAPITHIQQMTDNQGSDYSIVFSCESGSTAATISSLDTSSGLATFSYISDPTSAWAPTEMDPISTTTFMGSAVWTYWSNPDPLYIWNPGSSTVSPHSSTPSGAKVVLGFGNYLFAFNMLGDSGAELGEQMRSRVRWCAPRDLTTWPAQYYIDLDADDGDEIRAAAVFKNSIIVFKQFKTFIIHWVGGQALFTAEVLDNTSGCVGPNAYIEAGNNLYFLGHKAAYKYDGAAPPVDIGEPIQAYLDSMDITRSQIADVNSDEEWYEVLFNFATADSEDHRKNLVLVHDFRFNSWSKFNLQVACIEGIDYGSNMMYLNLPGAYSEYAGTQIRDVVGEKEGLLVFGTYNGYVMKYGFSANDDTTPIVGYWKSRWLDFGDPTINKRIMRIVVLVEKERGDYYLHCDLFTDWNQDTPAVQLLVSLEGDQSEVILEKVLDFTKPCRSLQVKLYTDAPSSPFTVHKVLIEYLMKGRTKTT